MADDKSPNLSDSFQQMLSQWERSFDSFANELMGTENFSRTMNQAQNARLSAQQAFREFMGHNLSTANMPTREDVLEVADAVHALDKRVARIESMLAEMTAAVGTASQARTGPPRTRKPPGTRQPDAGGRADE